MQLNPIQTNTIIKNTLFQNTFNKTPIATNPIKFNIIEKTPLITKAFSAIPTTTNQLPYQTLYKAQEAREHLPESWAQKYLQNRFKQLNYTAPKNYINNRNDTMQMNSLADYIWKDIVGGIFGIDNGQKYNTAIGKWGEKLGLLGWLVPSFTFGGPLRTVTSTFDWLYTNYLDPLAHGKFGAFGLNLFTDFSETADLLANPTKGFILGGREGFLKSIGAVEGKGRTNYDYDTGFFPADLALEIITDPMTYIPFIGQVAKGAGLFTKGVKITEELGSELFEVAIKETDKALGENVIEEVAEKTGKELGENVVEETAKRTGKETVEKITRKTKIVNDVAERFADKKFKKALINLRKYSDDTIAKLPAFESLDNETKNFAEEILQRAGAVVESLDEVELAKAKRIAGDLAKKALEFKANPITNRFIREVFDRAETLFIKHQANTFSEALVKSAGLQNEGLLYALKNSRIAKMFGVKTASPETIAAFTEIINSANGNIQARNIVKALRKVYTVTNPILEFPDRLVKYGLGSVSGITWGFRGTKKIYNMINNGIQTTKLNRFIKTYQDFKIKNDRGNKVFDIFKYDEIGRKALKEEATELAERAIDPTSKNFNAIMYAQTWADTIKENIVSIRNVLEECKNINDIPQIRIKVMNQVTNTEGVSLENFFEKYLETLERVNKDANGIFRYEKLQTERLFNTIKDLEDISEAYAVPNIALSYYADLKLPEELRTQINDNITKAVAKIDHDVREVITKYDTTLNQTIEEADKVFKNKDIIEKEALTVANKTLIQNENSINDFLKDVSKEFSLNGFVITNNLSAKKEINTLIITNLLSEQKLSNEDLAKQIVYILRKNQKNKNIQLKGVKKLQENIKSKLEPLIETFKKNIGPLLDLNNNLFNNSELIKFLTKQGTFEYDLSSWFTSLHNKLPQTTTPNYRRWLSRVQKNFSEAEEYTRIQKIFSGKKEYIRITPITPKQIRIQFNRDLLALKRYAESMSLNQDLSEFKKLYYNFLTKYDLPIENVDGDLIVLTGVLNKHFEKQFYLDLQDYKNIYNKIVNEHPEIETVQGLPRKLAIVPTDELKTKLEALIMMNTVYSPTKKFEGTIAQIIKLLKENNSFKELSINEDNLRVVLSRKFKEINKLIDGLELTDNPEGIKDLFSRMKKARMIELGGEDVTPIDSLGLLPKYDKMIQLQEDIQSFIDRIIKDINDRQFKKDIAEIIRDLDLTHETDPEKLYDALIPALRKRYNISEKTRFDIPEEKLKQIEQAHAKLLNNPRSAILPQRDVREPVIEYLERLSKIEIPKDFKHRTTTMTPDQFASAISLQVPRAHVIGRFNEMLNNIPEEYRAYLTKEDFIELYNATATGSHQISQTSPTSISNFLNTVGNTADPDAAKDLSLAKLWLQELLINQNQIPTTNEGYSKLIKSLLNQNTLFSLLGEREQTALINDLIQYLTIDLSPADLITKIKNIAYREIAINPDLKMSWDRLCLHLKEIIYNPFLNLRTTNAPNISDELLKKLNNTEAMAAYKDMLLVQTKQVLETIQVADVIKDSALKQELNNLLTFFGTIEDLPTAKVLQTFVNPLDQAETFHINNSAKYFETKFLKDVENFTDRFKVNLEKRIADAVPKPLKIETFEHGPLAKQFIKHIQTFFESYRLYGKHDYKTLTKNAQDGAFRPWAFYETEDFENYKKLYEKLTQGLEEYGYLHDLVQKSYITDLQEVFELPKISDEDDLNIIHQKILKCIQTIDNAQIALRELDAAKDKYIADLARKNRDLQKQTAQALNISNEYTEAPFERLTTAIDFLNQLKKDFEAVNERYIYLSEHQTAYNIKLEKINTQDTISDAYYEAFDAVIHDPIVDFLKKLNPDEYPDETARETLIGLQAQIKQLERVQSINNLMKAFNKDLLTDAARGYYSMEQVRAIRSTLQNYWFKAPQDINDIDAFADQIFGKATAYTVAMDMSCPLRLDDLHKTLDPTQTKRILKTVKDQLGFKEDIFSENLAHTGAYDVVRAYEVYKTNKELFKEINTVLNDPDKLAIIVDTETGGFVAATSPLHDISYYIPKSTTDDTAILKSHILSKDNDAYQNFINSGAKTINDRPKEVFDSLHDKKIMGDNNPNYIIHDSEEDLLKSFAEEIQELSERTGKEVHLILHNGDQFDIPFIKARNELKGYNIEALENLFGENSNIIIDDSLRIARSNSNYTAFSEEIKTIFKHNLTNYIEGLRTLGAKNLIDIDQEHGTSLLYDLYYTIYRDEKDSKFLRAYVDSMSYDLNAQTTKDNLLENIHKIIQTKKNIREENRVLDRVYITKESLSDETFLKNVVEQLEAYRKELSKYSTQQPIAKALKKDYEYVTQLIEKIKKNNYTNLTQLLNVFQTHHYLVKEVVANGNIKYIPTELLEATPRYGFKKLEHDDIIGWFINPETSKPFKSGDPLILPVAQELSSFSKRFKRIRDTIVSENALKSLNGDNDHITRTLNMLIRFIREGYENGVPLLNSQSFNRAIMLFNPAQAESLTEKMAAILAIYECFDYIKSYATKEDIKIFSKELKRYLDAVDVNLKPTQIKAYDLYASARGIRSEMFKTNKVYSSGIRRRYAGQLRGIIDYAIKDEDFYYAKGLLSVDKYEQRVYNDLLDLAESVDSKYGFKAVSTANLMRPSVLTMKSYLDLTLHNTQPNAHIFIGRAMEDFTNSLALQELDQVLSLDVDGWLSYFTYQTPLPYVTFCKQDLSEAKLSLFFKQQEALENAGIKIVQEEDRIYVVLKKEKRAQPIFDRDLKTYRAYTITKDGIKEINKTPLKELDFEKFKNIYAHKIRHYAPEDKSKVFFDNLLSARKNIIKLSDEQNIGTINGLLTVEKLEAQYENLPDAVKALLPSVDEVKNSPLFRRTLFDRSNLGSIASRKQLNEFTSANYLTTLAHHTEYAAERASDTSRLLSLYYDSNLAISNGIYKDIPEKELRAYLREHPEYVLTALVEDTKHGGYMAVKINPFNKTAIEQAKALDAVILPDETYRTLAQALNYNILQDDKLSIFNKLVYMYKTGFLALSPGVIMRNVMDGMLKNLVVTKDISVLKDQFVAADLWRRYSEASEEILKMHSSGLEFTEALEAYFKKSNAKLTRAEYNFVDSFSRTSASASLSKAFKDFYIKKNVEHAVMDGTKKSNIFDNIWTTYVKGTEFLMSPMTTTEQWFRLGEYINLLKRGMPEEQALYKVISTHFDYSSKTNAARLLELIIPFYNYKMSNLNFWAEQLSKDAHTRALFTNLLQELENMDQVSNEDLKYNRSLTYFLTSGNIDLSRTILGHTGIFGNSEEANMSLKTSFSFMDAANLLMTPIESIKGSLISPLQTAVNYGLYAMKDKLPEGAKEVLGVSDNMLNTTRTSLTGETTYYTPGIAETILNNLPIIGAVKQRYGTLGPKYAAKTGSILPQILPDVFGSINKTKSFSPSLSHTHHPTHTTQPTSYTPSPKRTYPTKSYPTKTYAKKTYAKKTYAKKAYAKKTYAKKTYAKKAYPKRSYANINYTNNYTPGLFARTRQFTPNKYKPNYSGILFNSSKLGYKSLFYKNFYYKHYTKKGKRYMDMRTAKYTPRNLRFKILATNKLFA